MGILEKARELAGELASLERGEHVDLLNQVRQILHEGSPFRDHPVDFVAWTRGASVVGNDYNPNTVAPPEMELLALSIRSDGFTQPIVANRETTGWEVVDGFHRSRVGKEHSDVSESVHGYLPVVQIRSTRQGAGDRIAATIRHNRARGKHGIEEMSSIVAELTKKAWPDAKIQKELGMDADEVLRLKQITGLAELFADEEFSMAWEAPSPANEEED